MLQKKLKRVGNSVALILPKDLVEAADLHAGDEVSLTLHGRRIVVEPAARVGSKAEFQTAWDAVLKRHGEAFRQMAEFDRSGRRNNAK